MANFLCFFCALVIYFISDANCATTSKYVSYNSSDLSYLSNGIQFPVQTFEEQDPIIEELVSERLPDMEWIAQLYNHHNWKKRLIILNNEKCRSHLSQYLEQLENGTLWAVKTNDASGRYSSQFFFGNDYWLGSHTLCDELQLPEENTEIPPFPLHFYVAKIRININDALTPVTRQLNLGQCLPSSCSTTDVRRLLAQERSQGKSLAVVGIRAVPGDYSLWDDFKFHIVGGVGVFVASLVLIATIVDYCMNRNKTKEANIEEANNNMNKDVTKSMETNIHHNKCSTILEFNKNLLLCFSALTNGKKILSVNNPSNDSIRCLHGLRFFSIAWIVLVHSYLEVFAIADNKSFRTLTERRFFYQTISNATFSVDTFFFISGLLLTLTFLRAQPTMSLKSLPDEHQIPKRRIKSDVAKYFTLLFYRYIRLTPAYLFVLGLNELTYGYYHNNSAFTPAIIDHISCSKYWWRNALYINNFFPNYEFCMFWSWYMSNDMQFFAIATVILIVAVRNEKCFRWAVGAVLVFLLSSWITTFIIAMQYKYIARIEEPFALFDEMYDKPWMRIGSYLVGMATAYVILKVDKELKIPKVIVILCWILSLSCLASLVYGLGKEGIVIPTSAFYASLGHTAWGLSLAWITIACCTGYGGPINAFLGFRGLLPLSRLTYCAYLVHPVIMCITSFEMDGPIHLHEVLNVVIFCGNMVFSFLLAFGISLGFEAPFVGLLKLMSNKQK